MKFCPECGGELREAELDGETRMQCASDDCSFVFWDNPTPVVAAIVELDGDIILARNKAWPPKMFGLVTGFLEKGETPDDGIVREVSEELGLDTTIEGFIGYYSFFQQNELILAFHVKAAPGAKVVLGGELDAYKRVPPHRLRPWPFGTGLAVRDWLLSEASRED